jgi:hypothetical protein
VQSGKEIMNIDLNNYDTTTLAKIWNTLNVWDWAYELGKKPKDFDTLLNSSSDTNIITKSSIATPIMNKIVSMIGIKECLRWHNIFNLHYNNDEFEKWWSTEKSMND